MSKTNPDHPWHASLTTRQDAATRHSPQFVAAVLVALAHASQSEIAAASGLTRNAICGLVARAKRAGAQVVHKHGRAPAQLARIERVAHVHTPKPKPEPKPKPASTPAPTVVPPTVHGTGVTLLEVRAGQCRSLDAARHCCCLPTVPGSSWCAGHRALYVRSTMTRRAA